MSEVMRWKLKGFIPGVEGESKAVFQPVVVLAEDYDKATRLFLDAAERCLAAERREQALQLRLNAADQRIDELTVPAGYCLMPTRLTAENGAKALLLGEFKLGVTTECPECRELEEPLEGCEVCDGEGKYGQQHMISWDQTKLIYSEAVAGLSIKAPLQHPAPTSTHPTLA
ncbi:hypothetical protein [Pseudomonas sp. SDO5591_S426]